MAISDNIRDAIRRWLLITTPEFDTAYRDQQAQYKKLYDYATGKQMPQLRVREGQADDNIILNFTGLVVERSISLLLGGGVEFDLPGATTQEMADGKKEIIKSEPAQVLDDIWDTNKKQILLHKVAQLGSRYGTCYIKIIPEGMESRKFPGRKIARLIALNPRWMTVETVPEDAEKLARYITRFEYTGKDSQGQAMTVQRMETVEREIGITKVEEQTLDGQPVMVERPAETGYWVVRQFVNSQETGGKWQQVGKDIQWPYEFPPIIHWQNLPESESPYGVSDIQDILILQDKTNFVSSNLAKMIRYFAHPFRFGRGLTTSGRIDVGPDSMVNLTGQDATLEQLNSGGDVVGSMQFANSLRQAMFDISRTVDVTSLADRLGALTNFGLRVLFMDALAKLGTKQELYGDALQELNHRLLVVSDYADEKADGGKVVWPDPLPTDDLNISNAIVAQYASGLVSKATGQERLGYDPEEQARKQAEEGTQEGNVGEKLINAFNRGW